jgi:hypothetical protein
MVDLELTDDHLAVRITGSDRVWALSSGVEVPLREVAGAQVLERAKAPRGVRAPGTHWPGAITAGTFRWGGKRRLWAVRGAQDVLVIRLRGERLDAVVVEVPDPQAEADRINRAVGAAGG